MTFGHLPAGYFTAVALEPRWRGKIPSSTFPWLVFASVVLAVAPDFDSLPFYLRGEKAHHVLPILHSFFPYVFIVLPVAAWLICTRRNVLGWLLALWALGGISHIVLDFLSHGVAWFYPLDKRLYTLRGIMMPLPESPASTFHQPLLLIELAADVFMVRHLICRRRPNDALAKWITFSSMILIVGLVAFFLTRELG